MNWYTAQIIVLGRGLEMREYFAVPDIACVDCICMNVCFLGL